MMYFKLKYIIYKIPIKLVLQIEDKLVILSQGKVIGAPLNLSCKWNLPNQIKRSNRMNTAFNYHDEVPRRLVDLGYKAKLKQIEENINGNDKISFVLSL